MTTRSPNRQREELVDEALDTLDWREDDRARRNGLRRFKRRQLLRTGAATYWASRTLRQPAGGCRISPTRASRQRCSRWNPRSRSQ